MWGKCAIDPNRTLTTKSFAAACEIRWRARCGLGQTRRIYRHIGNNAKIGVGYEWGDVSDDLTGIQYANQGVFLNLIAKCEVK